MKIVKANQKTRITLSKKEWKEIGKTAGWLKTLSASINDYEGKITLTAYKDPITGEYFTEEWLDELDDRPYSKQNTNIAKRLVPVEVEAHFEIDPPDHDVGIFTESLQTYGLFDAKGQKIEKINHSRNGKPVRVDSIEYSDYYCEINRGELTTHRQDAYNQHIDEKIDMEKDEK